MADRAFRYDYIVQQNTNEDVKDLGGTVMRKAMLWKAGMDCLSSNKGDLEMRLR